MLVNTYHQGIESEKPEDSCLNRVMTRTNETQGNPGQPLHPCQEVHKTPEYAKSSKVTESRSVVTWGWRKRRSEKEEVQRTTRKLLGHGYILCLDCSDDGFMVLTCVKTYQIVHSKYLEFTVYQLYHTKTVKKNIREKKPSFG